MKKTSYNKYLIYVLLFGIISLPLFFSSNTMYPWIVGKTLVFGLCINILTIYIGVLLWNKRIALPKYCTLDILVVCFFIWALFVSLIGSDPVRSVWGYQSRMQGVFFLYHFTLLYLLLRIFLRRVKDWIPIFVVGSAVVLLHSLAALFGPKLSIFDNIITKGSRVGGLIGNPIFLANYLFIPIFVSLGVLINNTKDNLHNIGFCLVTFVMCTVFLFTGTRGPFIGLCFGLIAACVSALFFWPDKKQRKNGIYVLCVGLVLCASVFFLNYHTNYIQTLSPRASALLNISPDETTGATRLMAWKLLIKGVADKPVFGWGAETYTHVFNLYYNPDFLQFSFAETVWDKPHNYTLEILLSFGTIGLVLYIGIIVVCGRYLLFSMRKARKEPKTLAYYGLLFGAIVGYPVSLFFSFETFSSMLCWFFLLGFVAFLYCENSGCDGEEKNTQILGARTAFLTLLTVLMFVSSVCMFVQIRMYHASILASNARDAAGVGQVRIWYESAEAVLDYTVPFYWENILFLSQDVLGLDARGVLNKEVVLGIVPRLISVFENRLAQVEYTYLEHYWLGQLYTIMGEYVDVQHYGQAVEHLEEAGGINGERQHIPFLLAKTYLLMGEKESGVRVLEDLVEKNNSYVEPQWYLGLALMDVGREAEAFTHLEKGFSYGATKDENILYMIDIYAKKERYEDVARLYEQLVRRNPTNAQWHAGAAATYAELGQIDNMVKHIQVAIHLDPSLLEEARVFLKKYDILIDS